MDSFRATVGKVTEIPVVFGSTTGLTLAGLDTVQVVDGIDLLTDFATDYEAELTEVDSGSAAGLYLLSFVPLREGAMYFRLVEGIITNTFVVQCELAVPPFVADPSLQADYTVHVVVGSSVVSGATVRVYDSTGTTLVAVGTTDSSGDVTFALETGEYQLRFNKPGVSFDDLNPTDIVVLPNDNVSPVLLEVYPSTAAIGDFISLRGQYFSPEESEVMFGATVTNPEATSTVGTGLLVEVPLGLTDTVIAVRVRKPDPDNPGEYLFSNVVNFTRTS